MGTSVRQDDPKLRLQYLQETGQDAEAKQYEQYLRETGQTGTAPAPSPLQVQVRQAIRTPAGRARLEANNRDLAEADQPSYLDIPRETVETVFAGIPGVKLARSWVQSKLTGRKLSDVQKEVNDETSDVPYASAAGRMLGTLGSMALLPGGAAAQGAMLGGADQLLANDQSGLGERAVRGVLGAGMGAAIGKGSEMGVNAVRAYVPRAVAKLTGNVPPLKTAGDVLKDSMEGVRAGQSAYGEVLSGGAKPLTKETATVLAKPDVTGIVDRVMSLEQNAGKKVNDPEVLHQIYTELTDWGHTLDKQGNAFDPSKPNMVRGLKTHVRALKDQFLSAMDAGQLPGYSTAVRGYARESAPINAAGTAYDAMSAGNGPKLTGWNNLGKKGPSAVADVLENAAETPGLSQTVGQGSSQGTLAALADLLGKGKAVGPLWRAGPMLRASDAQAGNTLPSSIPPSLLAALSAWNNK